MARDFTDILNAVWAANALTTIPNPPIPGQAYRNTEIDDSNLENGQQYSEVYDSARYNQLLYLLSGCVKMLMETGIPEWSAEQNYQQNAYTIGSDGKLYGPAKKASGPDNGGAVDPVTDAVGEATTWTLSLPDFEAPLTFDAAEGKVKLSVGNTTTVTDGKLETKIDPNGGLQSSATGVGIKPVSGSPVTVDANGVNVSTFTAPTASTPGKPGLVPGPGATSHPQNVILTAGLFKEVDLAFMHPSAESVELNKTRVGMGAVTAEGVNIDTFLRAGIFTANAFGGTLPTGVVGGVLYNIMSMDVAASTPTYYGIQILFSWNAQIYIRTNLGGIAPGGTVTWSGWTQIGKQTGTYAPLPTSAAALGQWVSLLSWSVKALYLPQGGVWAWFYWASNAGSSIIQGSWCGISAGGSLIGSNANGLSSFGFAWRIA